MVETERPASDTTSAQWASAREKARRLIEAQGWLNIPEWAAGRIVHNPRASASGTYLGIALCLMLAAATVVMARDHGSWKPLMFTAIFLLLVGVQAFFLLRARHGKSECVLRSMPARIGGTLEAEVRVRLRAKPGGQVRASLAAVSTIVRGAPEIWRAEVQIDREQIQIAQDGTWTIPVCIAIPSSLRAVRGLHPVCHIDELHPGWVLEMRAETGGPDYTASFNVPVCDLADLPYDAEQGRHEHRPVAFLRVEDFLGREVLVGVLVGAFLGFIFGFGYAGQVRYAQLEGIFLGPFLGAIFAFGALIHWRFAIAQALRDLDQPEHGSAMRLWLLRLAPWAVAALVLWLAWLFLPFGATLWGIGMLLCARSNPFGGLWRDPVLHSGATLTLLSLVL